jgi:hypothetical protein
MTNPATSPGAFHLRFDPPAWEHPDACACDAPFDDSREQIAEALESCTEALSLLAWIDVDGDQMCVLRGMKELHEFLSDALSDCFDTRFDGAWLLEPGIDPHRDLQAAPGTSRTARIFRAAA